MRTRTHLTKRKRAQSETVGFVLIIGIVITGALLVAGFGLLSIQETEDSLSEDRAENTLTQFDSKAALVALGESSSQRTVLQGSDRERFSIEEDNGWFHIVAMNRTTETVVWERNVTLGAVVYDGPNSRMAYQGGGVWRATDSGGEMISPPEFHFRDSTLTLPIVTVRGDSNLGSTVMVENQGRDQLFPSAAAPNPLDNHVVTVTVGGEFYGGWAQYFQTRTDGDTTVLDASQRARIELVSHVGEASITGAVAGQSSDGDFLFQANPGHPCAESSQPPYFDSYNSENGSYCSQYDASELQSSGQLIFGGDINTHSAAGNVQGDLIAGGSVDLFQNLAQHGDIRYGTTCTNCQEAQDEAMSDTKPMPDPDGYDIQQISGVDIQPPIDRIVDQTINEGRQTLNATTITNGDEVEAGTYYTEYLNITGDLTFNTSDGSIALIVEKTIDLEGANVEIHGDDEVDVFVGGDTGTDLRMIDSRVWAPDNDATSLSILGDSDFTTYMEDGQFTGLIYAPGETGSEAEFQVIQGGNIYGAIVTGDMTVGGSGGGGGGGGTVHYDRALHTQRVIPPNFGLTRITYLHITENQLTVSD